ncbi:MAG: hypothetical protein HYV63_28855, partial [Candidatus Schekmanbacteria bacterium]|nr:hypothetical protein [Candidatus Schekmanbacteria bacterium]
MPAGDAADGTYAVRSAPLADGGAAVLEVELELFASGSVRFWLKTSTEAGSDATEGLTRWRFRYRNDTPRSFVPLGDVAAPGQP